MDIFIWLIVGLIAGALATHLVDGGGFGLVGDICVGIAGAVVGGWLFRETHWHRPIAGLPGEILVAALGAIIVLVVLRIARRHAPSRSS